METAIEVSELVVSGTPGKGVKITNHLHAPGAREFQVDRYLKGSGPGDIVVTFDICDDQWANSGLLVLNTERWGLSPPPCFGPYALAEVEAITGPGQSPDPPLQEDSDESEHKDVPWVPIVILAILIPLAALLVPAFLLGRRDSSREGGE